MMMGPWPITPSGLLCLACLAGGAPMAATACGATASARPHRPGRCASMPWHAFCGASAPAILICGVQSVFKTATGPALATVRPNHDADSAATQTLDSQWTGGHGKLLTFFVISTAPAGEFPQEKQAPAHTAHHWSAAYMPHALRPVGAFAALGTAATARVL